MDSHKDVTVTLGIQPMPGQGPTGPNARIVLIQPNRTNPDGSVRDVAPMVLRIEGPITVVHSVPAGTLGALVSIMMVAVIVRIALAKMIPD